MEEMPGDFGEHVIGGLAHDADFASHSHDGGDGLAMPVFDTVPHDPADAIPAETHADHIPVHHHAPHDEPHYPRPGAHLEMDIYGIHYDAGRVEVDMNGDGHADTAVIHSERDGVTQVEYYTDNDGDGHADELTITDEHGQLISHTQLDEHSGQWVETHLDHTLPDSPNLPDR